MQPRDRDKQPAISAVTGIDNLSPVTSLRPGAVRELVNTDLNNKLQPQRRGGYELFAACTYAHSGFAHPLGGLAVMDNVLTYITPGGATTPLRAGLPLAPLSYAEIHGDIYWTNGHEIRALRELEDEEVWPDCPGQPAVSAIAGSGGLAGGTYQVACTVRDAAGRESGSTEAEFIEVPDGGSIVLSALPSWPTAAAVRVYVGPHNGKVLYWARDVAPGTTSVTISGVAMGAAGKELETQFQMPLPAGQIIRRHGTRLWVAADDHVYFGEAFRAGLTRYDSAFRMPGRVDLMQPVGDAAESGMFVAADERTFFFSGTNPETMTRRTRYPHGAIPGSGLSVPGAAVGLGVESVAVWLSTNGVFCAGLPTGEVRPLTEGQVVLPGAERAAAMVRERNGLRQILMALNGQIVDNPFAMTDEAVVTVRRNGVILP